MSTNKREPEFDEPTDPEERADLAVEEAGLPDNDFGELARQKHEDGESWDSLSDKLYAVADVVGEGAMEEKNELLAEWRVAVRKHDPMSTSGERYEFHEQAAATADEAETRVHERTGLPVEEEKTEQIGTAKVF